MPRQSKKRSRLNLKGYKAAIIKRHKPADIDLSSPVALVQSSTHNTTQSTSSSLFSTKLYHVTIPSEGIDLCTFRLSSFTSHKVRNNISAIVTKTQNSKFTELSTLLPKSQNNRSSTSCASQLASSSITNSNQPKISSFFSSPQSSNSTHYAKSSLVTHLVNKSRCVVEDFMLLQEQSEVVILVPTLSSKQHPSLRSVMSALKCFNIIQFGLKNTNKYHLVPAKVKQNKDLEDFDNNVMELTEVTSAFSSTCNNDYGLTFNLCIGETELVDSNKLMSRCVLLKWVDILNSGTDEV